MPYGVFKTGSDEKPYCVYRVNEDGNRFGKSLGCHPSDAAARGQISAIGIATHELEEPMKIKELSLDGIRDALWSDIRNLIDPSWGVEAVARSPSWWIEEVWRDHLILQVDEKYYKVPYVVAGDEVTIAPPNEWEHVKKEWVAQEKSLKDLLWRNEDKMVLALAGKPYPNEHACRLRSPGDFQEGSFRSMTRESDGKEYRIIMGRLEGETTMTEQAYRYPKDGWTADAAKSHCEGHDGASFEAASEEKEASFEKEVKTAMNYFQSLMKKVDSLLFKRSSRIPQAAYFKTVKAQDGKDWILTWTTNAFQDREREIISIKSIEEYVERHKEDELKGVFCFWHMPGTKFADIHFQGVTGRFLVEAGPFDDTELGQAFKEFFNEYPEGHPAIAPEGWGTSHTFLYRVGDDDDGVYDWFEKEETSVLPLKVASNQHSPGLEVIGVKEEQLNALKAIMGDEEAQRIVSTGETLTKQLEAAGIANKEVEEAKEEAEPKAEMEADDEGEVEPKPEAEVKPEAEPKLEAEPVAEAESPLRSEVAEALKLISETISTQNAAIIAIAEKVDALSKSDEEKISKQSELTPTASLASIVGSVIGLKETLVDGRTKLAKSGPEETQPEVPSRTGIPVIDALIEANKAHQSHITQ